MYEKIFLEIMEIGLIIILIFSVSKNEIILNKLIKNNNLNLKNEWKNRSNILLW